MQRRKKSLLAWIILGAVVGGFAALFLIGSRLLDVPGWLAALLPLLGAVLFGALGRNSGPPKMDPPDVGV